MATGGTLGRGTMADMSTAALKHTAAPDGARGDRFAARLRGFGFVGVLALSAIYVGSVIVPGLGALLVLAWAWRSRTPWSEIGFSRPDSWVATIGLGIALGLALRGLMKFLVMPLLGAPAVNPAFHHLEGNSAALPLAIFMMGFVAAFGEEVVMRGFLFERLTRLLGRGKAAMTTIVLVTAILFGLGHYSLQGPAGAQHAAIMGLVFGSLYALTNRLWLPVVTHAAFNLAGLAIIYLGVGAELDAWFWGAW
jgi:hypothetical protein